MKIRKNDDDDDDDDDNDDYKSDQDGSESDDDSGGEEREKGRYSSPLNTPMTDKSAIQLADSNETGMKTSTSETTRLVAPPLTMQLTGDQPDVALDAATISRTMEQVVAKEGPMASSMRHMAMLAHSYIISMIMNHMFFHSLPICLFVLMP